MNKTANCHCCGGTGKELDHARVGSELRAYRAVRNLTMARVAKRMGLSESYVSELERGKRNWNDALVERYRKAVV